MSLPYPGPVEGPRLTGLIGIVEQKHTMVVTTAKPVAAFRVLPMTKTDNGDNERSRRPRVNLNNEHYTANSTN